MNKIGLFYGSTSGRTETTALSILKYFGKDYVELYDVGMAVPRDLMNFNRLILGIPTWGIGEMQEDWENFMQGMQNADLSGKKIALFGLGDQESYPDTFADALGKLYDRMVSMHSLIIGTWPGEGYYFNESFAYRGNQFVGLVLDEDNQAELSDQRVQSWLRKIMPDLK